ncbi:MAG: hypothetical protein JO100_08365 [Pseudonocardia sp.]|nr:hypothetical protein [Pseudonocardia sp.]
MSVNGPDQLLRAVLPPALEVLTAWSIAETEADPSVFRHAMNRALGDAAATPDPQRGLAQMMFGLSSLSGILLDELAAVTGRSRSEVLHGVHLRYLGPDRGPSR